MKIYNNYNQFYRLFKLFIPKKQYKDKEEIYILEFTSFYDQLSSYKVQYDSLKSIYNYWNTFFPKSKKDEKESLRALIDTLSKTLLDEFDSKKESINKYLSNKNQAQKGIELQNSKFFMTIYNISKNKFNNLSENEIFDKAIEEFQKIKEWGTKDNLKDLDEELKRTTVEYIIEEKNKLINELYFIQNYFGLNKNDNEQNQFNIEDILVKIEELSEDIVADKKKDKKVGKKEEKEEKLLPEPIKILRERFHNFLDFYKICSNSDIILDEYIKFFKELFENKNIIKLEDNYLEEDVINIMKTIFFYCFEYNTQNYSGDKKQIYIINDFFDIFEVYSTINKNNLSDCIKKLFNLISDRFEYKGFNKDFEDIQNNLFSEIIENNKANEKEFSKCFINILIQEIKKEKVETKADCDKILKYVIDSKYLIDDCIPLINELYEDKFFTQFKKKENKNIYIDNSDLALLDKYCNNSRLLKERLLFYFESNINRIMTEKYEKTFIKDSI